MNFTGKYYELCVLIPCYNNLAGLKKSIESINYDQAKYLVLIVDDGSNEFISKEAVSQNNSHLNFHLIHLQQNKGITIALNTGLQWIIDTIKCSYIARLDCGDICDPERFYKQIEFLRVNTDIVLIGSWCYFKNQEKKITFSYKTPLKHKAIKKALYFRNVFIHPTVVVRYDVLARIGLYPDDYPYAEDYAWFWKIANEMKTAILPLYLVSCEMNIKGISYEKRAEQLESRLVIVKEFGHKFALRQLSIIKIWFLMKIPYSIILNIKRLISS